MSIEALVRQALERIAPGAFAAAEERAREALYDQRAAAAQRHEGEQLRLTEELATATAAVAKAQSDVDRKRDLLDGAVAKLSAAQRQRANVQAALDAENRAFAASMRDASTRDFLTALAGRVDALVLDAVPAIHHHTVYNRLRKPVEVTLAGDAGPRRVALWTLKRDILQRWHLEPLSRDGFEKKFADAIAALPALIAPISVEEYVRRSNAA
jgi:hypothetical protein